MFPMMPVLVLLMEVAACVGYGAAVLRLLHVRESLPWGERTASAFVLGIGVLGWLMFFMGVAGLFNTGAVGALLAVGVACLGFLGRPDISTSRIFSSVEKFLFAALFVTLALDLVEGLSPPADADSMAYHFALPKLFWQAGHLLFVPRAVDGAIPLLVQMTYIPVLGLGGEKALTLWTMVSGWGVAWALYFLCRRYLDRPWSLATVLIWLTTPVVLYGSGSGQVEVRNAGFAIVAVAALVRGRETGFLRYTVLAGLAAGMFVGAKYTGLFFATACGAALLIFRNRPRQIVLFGLAAVFAGFQWYVWNWIHTGDPVFPMLFGIIDGAGSGLWDAAHQQELRQNLFSAEQALAITPWSALTYPFQATFSTSTIFDSERAGMGLVLFVVLPFALAGLWRFRDRITGNPLFAAALVVLLFYLLWFFSGSSQRVRHLTPVYPVALMLFVALSYRWAQVVGAVKPLMLAVFLALGLQIAGHGASSINYIRYQASSEGRDHFLARNISGYGAVAWINENLKPTDRILTDQRQLIYLIDIPTFYAHTSNQNSIDMRPEAYNPALYYQQLKKLGITHILVTANKDIYSGPVKGSNQWKQIAAMGCAEEIGRIKYQAVTSRSLAISPKTDLLELILRVGGSSCPLNG